MCVNVCLNYIYSFSQTHTFATHTTLGACNPDVNALAPPTACRHLTPRPVLNTRVAVRCEGTIMNMTWFVRQRDVPYA